jgi:peptidoglycan glycosyltransferase
MKNKLAVGLVGVGSLLVAVALCLESDTGWWLGMGVGLLTAFAGLAIMVHKADRQAYWLMQVQVLLLVGFLALAMQLVRFQLIEVRAVMAGSENPLVRGDPRDQMLEETSYRGALLDRHGTVLARSVPAEGVFRREYPPGRWGNLLGYYSPRFVGKAGLELSLDQRLSGRRGNGITGLAYRALGRRAPGNDVWLTLDARLQQKADSLLGGRGGAVVLLDAQTGAILVASSSPDFSPSELSDDFSKGREQDAQRVMSNWQRLARRNDAPLINRALQGLYPPGSVFKTVTLLAALASGQLTMDSMFTDAGSLNVGGHVIADPNRPDPIRTRYTLEEGYIWSLNAVFAQAALRVGRAPLEATARALGFGTMPLEDFPAAVSLLYHDPHFLEKDAGLADTGFGQGQILATPLQMAMVAMAVANEGELPVPHFLEKVVTRQGEVTFIYQARAKRSIDRDVALKAKAAMVESVRSGWARAAALPGVGVAGKTGTAENPQGSPHAWFIGFAPVERPRYVVAVVIENGGDGASVALPVGREMLQRALESQ